MKEFVVSALSERNELNPTGKKVKQGGKRGKKRQRSKIIRTN